MAAASAWADLPVDLLGRVIRRLPCLALRVAFAAVCPKWLKATLQRSPPLPQLPWLLLPYSDEHSQEPCFCCLICRTTHRAVLPADIRRARWCGSGPGGWLLVALQQSGGYAAHNLYTGERGLLPEILRTPDPVEDQGTIIIHAARGKLIQDVTCFAAVIERSASSTIAFCRGDANAAGRWTPPMPAEIQERGSWMEMLPRARIADVLYYSGHGLEGFHVLTDREDLLVYVLGNNGPDGALTTRLVTYHFPDHEITASLGLGEICTLTRYLVNYFGELLMVVRVVSPEGTTTAFRMVKLVPAPATAQADDHGDRNASWEPMHVIPTGMLFLGRCTSSASSTYGIDFDGVYFLDDATSFNDAAMALESPEARRYPCSDMGYLPLTSHDIQQIFPAWPPSEYSRAVWFFMQRYVGTFFGNALI